MTTPTLEDTKFETISNPYLLVSGIPIQMDKDGVRWADSLWHKDLQRHLTYLSDFTLAAPLIKSKIPHNFLPLSTSPLLPKIKHVDLPSNSSLLEAFLHLPRTFFILWQAIGKAELIHIGIADWPRSLGWISTVITSFRKKFVILIIESAFWRVTGDEKRSWKKRVRELISEKLNRWCVRRSNLCIFTQPEYLKQLASHTHEHCHVMAASWIDSENILSNKEAQDSWNSKLSQKPHLGRFLFASRTIEAKGLLVFIEAILLLQEQKIPLHFEFFNFGELSSELKAALDKIKAPTTFRILESVHYGDPFFKILRDFDALIIPSLSDEQPRLVYDAYSQAVPVIGSDTAGLRICVQHGTTGILYPTGDRQALATQLQRAIEIPEELKRMGIASLEVVRPLTHTHMHLTRQNIISRALATYERS